MTTADVATISVAIAAAGPMAPASSSCRIEIDASVVFGEAMLTGMALTLAVVYRPGWVATFDDAFYLARR